MTATQTGPESDRKPHRIIGHRPVVRAHRDTPVIGVQRRAPVKLAAEAKRAVPFAGAIRVVARPALLFLAVILQLAVVNRLPLPGATAPDLVLLVACAMAVTAGPLAGTLAGFAGGLALDVAPPASHYVGEYALVFCLAGYGAGWVRSALVDATGERDYATTLAAMGGAVAAGEAGKAAIGLLLSDPAVTSPVVSRVLPAAILYDLLLCPVVLWVVNRAALEPRAERAPHPDFGTARPLAGVFRQASAGAAPNLRLVGSGGLRPQHSLPRRVPKLHLSDARSPIASRTSAALSTTAQPRLASGRTPKLDFTGDHPTPATRRRRSPARGWLRKDATLASHGGAAAAIPAVRRRPSRGWLRGDATLSSRGGAAAAIPSGRRGPSRGWIRTGMTLMSRRDLGTAAVVGRGGPAKGWLHPAKPLPPAKRRTPGPGWLRPAKPVAPVKRRTPSRGWLRPAKPVAPARRRTPGRGWLRPAKPPRPNWYTRGPSTRWLRRSRTNAWTRAAMRTLRRTQKGARW